MDIITVCYLLAMVPFSIEVRSKVTSDTVRRSKHAPHSCTTLRCSSLHERHSLLGFFAAWSFTNFRSQTACNKPGNENRPIAIFSGTKHLPYWTGDKTRNSGTVPDVPGHLATMEVGFQGLQLVMSSGLVYPTLAYFAQY